MRETQKGPNPKPNGKQRLLAVGITKDPEKREAELRRAFDGGHLVRYGVLKRELAGGQGDAPIVFQFVG